VELTGDTVLPRDEVEERLFVREGQVFSRRLLDATSDAISLSLSNIGYAFARVDVIPDVDRAARTVGIRFNVVPGPRVHVRHIEFKGNTRTADEVMRREMRQFEGGWYSRSEEHTSELQSRENLVCRLL